MLGQYFPQSVCISPRNKNENIEKSYPDIAILKYHTRVTILTTLLFMSIYHCFYDCYIYCCISNHWHSLWYRFEFEPVVGHCDDLGRGMGLQEGEWRNLNARVSTGIYKNDKDIYWTTKIYLIAPLKKGVSKMNGDVSFRWPPCNYIWTNMGENTNGIPLQAW